MSSMHKARPLSPHLQVYRPQLTSILSILHRATGVFLALGSILIVVWLGALASGQESYGQLQMLLANPFAQLVLLGWCFAANYHLCNGIRHLFWDIGAGLEIAQVYRSGMIVLVVSFALTAAVVLVALQRTGGWL